jgi:hypothetical protein
MGEFDLSLVKKDKEMVELLGSLFSSKDDKEGDFLAEELLETLEYASIFQPVTRSVEQTGIYESMRLGDLYSRAGVIGNSVKVAVLSMWNSRSYYLRDKGEQMCSSPNGVTPIHNKYSSKCATCRFAKFRRGKPSECTKFINILVMPADFQRRPFVLQFSRTGYRTGLEIAKQAKAVGSDLFDSVFEIKTEKAKDAAYYKYKVEGVTETPDKIKPAFRAVLNHYRPLVEASITRHEAKDEEPEQKEDTVPALENVE